MQLVDCGNKLVTGGGRDLDLPATYEHVRSGIVAFAPRHPEKVKAGATHVENIFGTGFIVGETLIATNRHVVEVFQQFPGDKPGKFDVAAIFFYRRPEGIAVLAMNVQHTAIGGKVNAERYYGPENLDLALVSVDCTGLSKYALAVDPSVRREGELMATAGFPMGPVLLHLEGRLDHISPTLQTGVISAVLPFEAPAPHGYLLNVMVQGGASGSPVFDPNTGAVTGVVYARMPQQENLTLPFLPTPVPYRVPTNFTNVVPSHFLDVMLKGAGPKLEKATPDYAKPVDEVIGSIEFKPRVYGVS